MGQTIVAIVAALNFDHEKFAQQFERGHSYAKLQTVELMYATLCMRMEYSREASEAFA